jgi:tetratricopeptide (TPR) repeat protein
MEEKLPEQGNPEKPGPGLPPPAPAPRDDVRVPSSLVRCPYCHEDVHVERDVWVACKSCLARHHATCWREGGACASCRTAEFVSMRAPQAPPSATGSRAAPVAYLAIAAVLLVVPIVLSIRASRGREEARSLEVERDAKEQARRAAETNATPESRRDAIAAEKAERARKAQAALSLGEDRRKAGDLEGALAELSRAIEIDPRLEQAWAARGAVRLARGEDPRSDLDAALEIDPRDAAALFDRAEWELALGEARGALRDAEVAHLAQPSPGPRGCLILAEAYLANGNGGNAAFYASNAIEREPGNALAYAIQALGLAAHRGDPAHALEVARKALELDPKLARAFEARGEAHAAIGDALRAVSDLEEAAKLAGGRAANRIQARIAELRKVPLAPPLTTRRLAFPFKARRVLPAPDRGKLLVLEEAPASRLHLWDRASGGDARVVPLQKGAADLALDSGRLVAACGESGVLVFLDPATLEPIRTVALEAKGALAPTSLFRARAPGKLGFLARRPGRPGFSDPTVVGEIDTSSSEIHVFAAPPLHLVHAFFASEALIFAQGSFVDCSPSGTGHFYEASTRDVEPDGRSIEAVVQGQRRKSGQGGWHADYGPALRLAGDRGFAISAVNTRDRRQSISYRIGRDGIDEVWKRDGEILAVHPADPLALVANCAGDPTLTEEWTVTGVHVDRGRTVFRGTVFLDAPVGASGFEGEDGTPTATIAPGASGDVLVLQAGGAWYEATLPSYEDVGDPPADVATGSPFEFAPRVAKEEGASFMLKTAPGGMKVDAATGRITWTPAETDLGEHQVELVVDRGGHETSVIEFSLRVRR